MACLTVIRIYGLTGSVKKINIIFLLNLSKLMRSYQHKQQNLNSKKRKL